MQVAGARAGALVRRARAGVEHVCDVAVRQLRRQLRQTRIEGRTHGAADLACACAHAPVRQRRSALRAARRAGCAEVARRVRTAASSAPMWRVVGAVSGRGVRLSWSCAPVRACSAGGRRSTYTRLRALTAVCTSMVWMGAFACAGLAKRCRLSASLSVAPARSSGGATKPGEAAPNSCGSRLIQQPSCTRSTARSRQPRNLQKLLCRCRTFTMAAFMAVIGHSLH